MSRQNLIALCAAGVMLAGCAESSAPAADEPTPTRLAEPHSGESSPADPENLQQAIARAQATRGTGSPKLWLVEDADTRVYLYGTVHLLRDGVQWKRSNMERAFASADTLITELDTSAANQAAVAQATLARGMYMDGTALTDVLDKAQTAVVKRAFADVGMPPAGYQMMQPWLASVTLSMLPLVNEGYDPQAGVEQVLEAMAKARPAMRMAYLETAAEQIAALADLSLDTQIEFLVETAEMLAPRQADGAPDISTYMQVMVDEWLDGDTAGLAVLIHHFEAGGGDDALLQALLVNRNRNWVEQITALLDTHQGTIFLAAGAGHFAGPGSVIELLTERGLTVQTVPAGPP